MWRGGVAPDAPMARVLSKASSTFGLRLVQEVSSCDASGATPAGVDGVVPGEKAGATPSEKQV